MYMIIKGPLQTRTLSASTLEGLDILVNKFLKEGNIRREEFISIKYWFDNKNDKFCASIVYEENRSLV